jgi:hypothetical protein
VTPVRTGTEAIAGPVVAVDVGNALGELAKG